MKNFGEIIAIMGQILFYILAIIIIIQIIKILVGGSWSTENAILALLILNITITFGIFGYLINLNNKISSHLGWHKGRENL